MSAFKFPVTWLPAPFFWELRPLDSETAIARGRVDNGQDVILRNANIDANGTYALLTSAQIGDPRTTQIVRPEPYNPPPLTGNVIRVEPAKLGVTHTDTLDRLAGLQKQLITEERLGESALIGQAIYELGAARDRVALLEALSKEIARAIRDHVKLPTDEDDDDWSGRPQ